MEIPNGTWVLVGDGEKYLLLENIGDDAYINLQVMRHGETSNPPTREQGTDHPGRFEDAGAAGKDAPSGKRDNAVVGRSAVEQTDWHRLEKERFAHDLAERLERWALGNQFDKLVVVADPHTLGVLRPAYHPEVKKRIVREVDKDLTKHPIEDIETILLSV